MTFETYNWNTMIADTIIAMGEWSPYLEEIQNFDISHVLNWLAEKEISVVLKKHPKDFDWYFCIDDGVVGLDKNLEKCICMAFLEWKKDH